eukprot:731699_1
MLIIYSLFAVLAISDRVYENAECSGGTIIGLRTVQSNNAVKFEIGQQTEDDITITSTPTPTSDWGIVATTIQPCTQIVYTLLANPPAQLAAGDPSKWILGTLNNPLSIATANIVGGPSVTGAVGNLARIPSITFNNEGTLYGLNRNKEIFEIDITTGNSVLVDTRTTDTGATSCDRPRKCNEVIGFNWDNGLFYRISSSQDAAIISFMECFEIEGPEMSLTWNPNDKFFCKNIIWELTYIGNDLWLVSCGDTIRLLDTSDGINANPLKIGEEGIIANGGGGLIATITDNEGTTLCEVQCPTNSPTEYPTEAPSQNPSQDPTQPSQDPTQPSQNPTQPSQNPTQPSQNPTQPSQYPTQPSQNPTMDPTVSSDSVSDELFDALNYNENVDDKNDNNMKNTNKNIFIYLDQYDMYQLWIMVVLILSVIVIGVLYCHYFQNN